MEDPHAALILEALNSASLWKDLTMNYPDETHAWVLRVVSSAEDTENLQLQANLSTSLQAQIDLLVQSMSDLRMTNTLLTRSLAESTQHTPVLPTPAPHQRSFKSEKLPDPPIFDGNPDNLRPFINATKLKLLGNEDRFPYQQDKLRYAHSRLGGIAAQQMEPYLQEGSIAFDTIQDLWVFLNEAFGDPDSQATSARKIKTLRQNNRDFQSYLRDFKALAPDTMYDDRALMDIMKDGISQELALRLSNWHIRIFPSLRELVFTLTQLDAAQQSFTARSQITGGRGRPLVPRINTPTQSIISNGSYQMPRFTAPPSSIPASSLGDPMDLSTARSRARGPASEQEKARRLVNRLCFYCGHADHIASTCPAKAAHQARLLLASEAGIDRSPALSAATSAPSSPSLSGNT